MEWIGKAERKLWCAVIATAYHDLSPIHGKGGKPITPEQLVPNDSSRPRTKLNAIKSAITFFTCPSHAEWREYCFDMAGMDSENLEDKINERLAHARWLVEEAEKIVRRKFRSYGTANIQ